MRFEIGQLLDTRNESLFKEIQSKIELILEPSEDDGWGERTGEGKATVYFSDTAHPIASFTHELLHIKLNLAGQSRPGFVLRHSRPEEYRVLTEYIEPMFPVIYNHLAHLRFYEEFVRLGFLPSEFLHDTDKEESDRVLHEDLPRLGLTCPHLLYHSL